MRFFFAGVLLLCAFVNAGAQQYLIKYDLINLKSNYYKISGDTSRVRNLDLKKNGRILLKVENFNPFYWNAKVTSFKNPVQEESGYGNVFNPITVLAQGLTNLTGSIPLLDLPASKGAGTDANSRFLNTAATYAENYQKVQAMGEKLDELEVIQLQLQELKYDFSKSGEQIKAEARELVKKALGTDNLTVMNTVTMGKQYTKELSSVMENLDALNALLQQQLPTVNPEARVEGKTFREIASKAGSSHAALQKLSALQQKNPNFLLDEIVETGTLFREINNASFQFTYALNAEPDLTHLKLELYPKAGGEAKDTLVQYFQLNGKKNLKIRNSVGVAFTYFTANNTHYFVGADSVINKSGKDLFSPLVSTFIHFYTGNATGFKWGGTFGMGIPLAGEKKDVNFLLGLTTAFGPNEPILLSFGLSGAKVNKLTKGYVLGGKSNTLDETKLVTQGYDVGGFVSVTFNLSGLGKK